MRTLSLFDYVLGAAFAASVGGIAYQLLSFSNVDINTQVVTPVSTATHNIGNDEMTDGRNSGRPKMVIPETIYNFGELGGEDIAKHEFEVFNEGDADLVIDPITPTCGCTSASISQNRIRPGGKAIITVELALDRAGKRNRSVAVTSNDSENSPLLLRLTGIVSEPRSSLVIEE